MDYIRKVLNISQSSPEQLSKSVRLELQDLQRVALATLMTLDPPDEPELRKLKTRQRECVLVYTVALYNVMTS